MSAFQRSVLLSTNTVRHSSGRKHTSPLQKQPSRFCTSLSASGRQPPRSTSLRAAQQQETSSTLPGGQEMTNGSSNGAASQPAAQAPPDGTPAISGAMQAGKPRRRALRALDAAGSPYVLLGAATLFTLIAWDVFGGSKGLMPAGSAHLLPQHVDFPVHTWVQGHVSLTARRGAEKVISNIPIWAASAGWLACAVGAVAQNPARGSRGVGIAVGFLWAVTGVGSGRADILVVDVLKHYFQRVRPSPLDHTYAFPSGHTTAAVFFLGALLYVILPLCAAGPDGDTAGGDLNKRQARLWDRGVSAIQENALALWALGGFVTAGGRVLADVHWVSDTMAGACLGVFLVSAAAQLCKLIRA